MRQGVEFATADAEFKLRLLKIKLSKYIELEYKYYSKSSYRSCAGGNFSETENVIWDGFGLISNTEKKFGPIMSNS